MKKKWCTYLQIVSALVWHSDCPSKLAICQHKRHGWTNSSPKLKFFSKILLNKMAYRICNGIFRIPPSKAGAIDFLMLFLHRLKPVVIDGITSFMRIASTKASIAPALAFLPLNPLKGTWESSICLLLNSVSPIITHNL